MFGTLLSIQIKNERAKNTLCSLVARRTGFEPTTFGSGGQHSIQLSYRRI